MPVTALRYDDRVCHHHTVIEIAIATSIVDYNENVPFSGDA